MNWQSIVLTSIASGAVSVVVSIVVLLFKQISDRRREEQKAKYGRASWLHQRQVEAPTKLFVEFHRMQDLLQGATRGFRSQGEMSQEGLFEKWQLKVAETWSEYIEHKLLFRSAPIYRENEMRKEAAAEQIKAIELANKLIPPLLEEVNPRRAA